MKTLIVFRHGKSDWSADYDGDHDRPVAKRGRKAAATMGLFLAATSQIPCRAISSSARRARQTLELAHEAGNWNCDVEIQDCFYDSGVADVLKRIQQEPESTRTLLITGHEPTWSDLISRLLGNASVRFPTAAMARIDLDVDSWKEANEGLGTLIWLLPARLLTDSRLAEALA